MMTFVLILCFIVCVTGYALPLRSLSIGRKSSLSKLTMKGGQTATDASKPTLVYFDARGAGEMVRVILKVSNAEFNDVRFSAKMANGKFETPEFDVAKTTGELNANMNRLPVFITETGVRIGQSKAIERYLARRYGLFGANPEEEALVDVIAENVRDIKEKWGKIRAIGGMGKQSEEKDLAIKKWFEEGELEGWLKKLELSLPTANLNSAYAVGAKLSYADLCIWNLLSDTFEEKYKEFINKALQNCPTLAAVSKQVSELPSLKAWLSSRPVTMF